MAIKTRCPDGLAKRFSVTRALGEGGMGAVFLGKQPNLDRPVALKVLRPDRAEAENLGRFKREAKVMASVEHPHMIRLLDHGVEEGHPYLVMEYIEGRTLAYHLHKNGGLDPEEAQRILIPVAEALQAVHEAGIIHRDIKPDNVMIDVQGRPLLMDMGLARFQRRGFTATGEGKIVGTIEYMAPEVLRGEPLTPQTDWYAWGVAVYETLHGDVPFQRDDVLERVVEYEMRWLRAKKLEGPAADHPLAHLAAWCMQGKRERRPKAFQQLQLVLDGKVPAPKPVWDGEEAEGNETTAVPREEILPGESSRSWLAPALGLAALVGVGVLLPLGSGPSIKIGEDVVVFTDGEGHLGVRLAPGRTGSPTLEVRTPDSTEPRLLPVDAAGRASLELTSPFSARLLMDGGVAGPWRDYPAFRRSQVAWLEDALVSGGVLLVAEGTAPEPGATIEPLVTPPKQVLVERQNELRPPLIEPRITRDQSFWWAAFPHQQGRLKFVSRQAPHAPVELTVRRAELRGPEASVETLREILESDDRYVVSDSELPARVDARRHWLRLRPYALAAWPALDDLRDRVVTVIELLISQEKSKARWTNAAAFALDLEELHPGKGRLLLSRLVQSGILDEKEAQRNHSRLPTALRLLRSVAAGLGRRNPIGETVLENTFLTTKGRMDRSFVEEGYRESFLPSPYVADVPERWISWVLWVHWLRPTLAKNRSPGGAAMNGMLNDFGSRQAPDFIEHPYRPTHTDVSEPPRSLSTFETRRAWASIGAEASEDRRARLAWVFLVGYLPDPGSPTPPATLEELVTALEGLPTCPLAAHAQLLRTRIPADHPDSASLEARLFALEKRP